MDRKLFLYSFLAVVVFGAGFILINGNSNYTSEQKMHDGLIVVQSHYTFAAEEPSDLRDAAKLIVKGTIVGKRQVIEYRDMNAELVHSSSPDATIVIPYNEYTIQIKQFIEKDTQDALLSNLKNEITVRMRGGDVGNVKYSSGYDEYNIGDELIALLDRHPNADFYQPTGAYHGVFKAHGGKAIGAERTLSEDTLLDMLTSRDRP